MRDFIISAIWRDLRDELHQWLEDIRNQLEIESNVEIIRRLQGNAEAVNRFIRLPEVMVEAMEMDYGRREL
jgi:hypothetical protein